MEADNTYDVLKPESTKPQIVAALIEALSYWIAPDDMNEVINAEVYSAKWSPAMVRLLVERAQQEQW